MKVLHSICQQIWKAQQWPQDWKKSILIPIPKKSKVKECSNYYTIGHVSHTRKVILKILQAWLQQFINHELPGMQADLEKAEEPEIKLPMFAGSHRKQGNSGKTFISASLTMLNTLFRGSQQTVENS